MELSIDIDASTIAAPAEATPESVSELELELLEFDEPPPPQERSSGIAHNMAASLIRTVIAIPN